MSQQQQDDAGVQQQEPVVPAVQKETAPAPQSADDEQQLVATPVQDEKPATDVPSTEQQAKNRADWVTQRVTAAMTASARSPGSWVQWVGVFFPHAIAWASPRGYVAVIPDLAAMTLRRLANSFGPAEYDLMMGVFDPYTTTYEGINKLYNDQDKNLDLFLYQVMLIDFSVQDEVQTTQQELFATVSRPRVTIKEPSPDPEAPSSEDEEMEEVEEIEEEEEDEDETPEELPARRPRKDD